MQDDATPSSLPLLTAPLRDLAAWTHHLRCAPVPVLAHTAAEIQQLAELEEARGCVDAQMIAQAISSDPLMSIRVLAHAGMNRSRQQVTDAETVTAALMLMGIGPFFTAFTALPTVEERLAEQPEAQAGLRQVLTRAHRAGQFALGFANHRMDGDAAAIHTAASLHDFAEMLLWCHAPDLALDIQRRQQADHSLRSATVQQEVLHTTLPQIEQALMRAWHLPELLIQLTDDGERHALIAPQRRIVQLAVRLARHSAHGWDDTALPDDLHDIADILNLSVRAAERLLHDLDS
jgi:HD-like signal output (HDOD) protein